MLTLEIVEQPTIERADQNVHASSNSSSDPRRPTLVLPSACTYSAIEVLNQIAALKVSCNFSELPCHRCYKFIPSGPRTNFREVKPLECIDSMSQRNLVMDYLAGRVYDAVSKGLFDLWNAELNMATQPYQNEAQGRVGPEHIRYWIKWSWILPDDVVAFCERERIHLVFQHETSTHQAEELPDNTITASNAKAPLVFIKPSDVRHKPEYPARTGNVILMIVAALELEAALGRRADHKDVMALMQQWAKEKKDTCLVRATRIGVVWKTQRDEQQDFTLELCRKAMQRWNAYRDGVTH
jgi:hypothetical protein